MRTKLLMANWKMHGDSAANAALLGALFTNLTGLHRLTVVICPTFIHLPQVAAAQAGSALKLGAQNVSQPAEGAYTGEVSARMLADIGCSHVLVGHSERRSLFGATDAEVAGVFAAARAAGLCPVLCVGETLPQRRTGETEATVTSQIVAVLSKVGIEGLRGAVIAYEPVWAIGTGESASPGQVQQTHQQIRQFLSKHDSEIASSISIIYGGSVKASTAEAIFAQPDVDGGLVGSASLDAAEFSAIARALDHAAHSGSSVNGSLQPDPKNDSQSQ